MLAVESYWTKISVFPFCHTLSWLSHLERLFSFSQACYSILYINEIG